MKKMKTCPKGAFGLNGIWAGQDSQKNEFWSANFKNAMGYNLYFWKLKEIAVSRVEWSGMSDNIDQRYLEEVLFFNGAALYSRDEVMGDMVSAFAGVGQRDIYNRPVVRDIYTPTGYHREVTGLDSVIIYNNYNRLPDIFTIQYYADRLWQLDRVIDINCNAQKTPLMVKATKDTELTIKNMWMQYDGNVPAIFRGAEADALNPHPIEVLQTGAPFVADKIQGVKNGIWKEALTFLGVDSPSEAKKEQLVSAEVRQNGGSTAAFRASFMKPREDGARRINAMFGTDIVPLWNSTIYEMSLAMPGASAEEQAANASFSEKNTGV